MSDRTNAQAFLLIDQTVGVFRIYFDALQAREIARACNSVIVVAPIIFDYREHALKPDVCGNCKRIHPGTGCYETEACSHPKCLLTQHDPSIQLHENKTSRWGEPISFTPRWSPNA